MFTAAIATTVALFAAASQTSALAQAKLLGYWDFNDNSVANVAVDQVHDYVGQFQNGAVYTDDQGGRTGAAGDRASRIAGGTQLVRVVNAGWLNPYTGADQLSVSFWQKLVTVGSSSSFWLASRSSNDGERGFQAHVPWSGSLTPGSGTIYFDTAGCCDAGITRINASVSSILGFETLDWASWHHFVFLKNGTVKQIWIDGVLFLEGVGERALPTDFYQLTIGARSDATAVINGMIDDFAVFGSGLTEEQIVALAQGASPLTLDADTDMDGMPDWWEDQYGLNKGDAADAAADADSDGLTNLAEYLGSTDPKNADSDGDGLKDGAETKTGVWVDATNTGTDPMNADTEGDGLKDGVETNTGTYVSATNTGTNPNVADTDGDKYGDGVEVTLGSNPVDPDSVPVPEWGSSLLAFWDFNDATDPEKTKDQVHGFVGNLENFAMYSADAGGRTGQAGDYAMDFGYDTARQLVRVANAAWLNAISVNDRATVSFWQMLYGPANGSSFWMVSPSSTGTQRGFQAHVPWGGTIYYDTAGCCNAPQRINKAVAGDFDWTAWHHFAFVKREGTKQIYIDGVLFHSGTGAAPLPFDFTELTIGAQNEGSSSIQGVIDDFAVFASALDASQIDTLAKGGSPMDFDRDTDRDGMPDLWEDANGFNKTDASDAAQDADADGLTNLTEYRKGTNPRNADTDADGLKDGVETDSGVWNSATDTGTDPFDADTDDDNLLDGVETNTGKFVSPADTGTNPFNKDTDGDKVADAAEIALGTDPCDPASVPIQPGQPNLLAFWDFNDATDPAKAIDKVHGFVGNVVSNAVYTVDQGGWSGKTGDRAMDFGYDGLGEAVMVPALWLGAVGAYDQVSITFWQMLHAMSDSAAFWGISPSSSGTQRGFSAHTPWSNNNIYFDTAGCCDGVTQRISASVVPDPGTGYAGAPGYADETWWYNWHHFVFLKDGSKKEIWIDGILFLAGNNTAPLPSDFTELQIGLDVPDGYRSLMGIMDDVAVFASGLVESQIKELAAGKSPLDIQSVTFTITGVAVESATQSLAITWQSSPGVKYTVLQSANLKDWTQAAQVDGAAGNATTYKAPLSAGPGAAFYRVQR